MKATTVLGIAFFTDVLRKPPTAPAYDGRMDS